MLLLATIWYMTEIDTESKFFKINRGNFGRNKIEGTPILKLAMVRRLKVKKISGKLKFEKKFVT